MSKVKMRCKVCGKWFQSANAKELTCPDCVQKARKEKMAAKSAPSAVQKPAGVGDPGAASHARTAPPPKPKSVHSGTSHWLDTLEDVKIARPEQPVRPRPQIPQAPTQQTAPISNRGATGNVPTPPGVREGSPRGPEHRFGTATGGQRPRQPGDDGGHGPRPARGPRWSRDSAQGAPRPKGKPKVAKQAPPRPKKEKTPPPQPFTPTAEQVALVEARYLELAQPSEFDGIRTQISKELTIPKKAVKKIISALRERQHIPSWWELQSYKGTPEELERIKDVYVPLLPVPPVGVHKQIAEQLDLKPTDIYQAIKSIRQEMNLPQYNDPTTHEGEMAKAQVSNGEDEAKPETAQGNEHEQASAPTEEAVTSEPTPSTAPANEAPAN